MAAWPDRDHVSAHDVTEALGGTWRGSYGAARCPAHEDRHPSLSISDGSDNRLLMRCHSGCDFRDIVTVLKQRGILPDRQRVSLGKIVFRKDSDQISSEPETKTIPPEQSEPVRVVARYDYQDEQGAVLFQSVRMEPKKFFQRRPNGHGGWIRNLDGVRLVPYRLPDLIGSQADEVVYIPEGEKDVDRLISLGFVATCNPMGAGKWRDEYSRFLTGRRVVVLPDNDEVGRKHGTQIRESVRSLAASVAIVMLPRLPDGGDVSDWLAEGGDAEGLRTLSEDAESVGAAGPRLIALTASDLLLGDAPPVPWLVSVPPDEDGVVRGGLLAHRETAIIGAASGTGKTWLIAEITLMMALGGQLFDYFDIARPCRIMLVDEESSLWLLRQRWDLLLRGHGIERASFAREVFNDRIKIFLDQGFSFDDDRSLDALHDEAQAFRPDVVLFDTLARIHRRPENDNSQIASLFEDRIKPFKRSVGCGMIFAHHVRKAAKDAPNDPASLLRGASDLKGQLDEFWFLRGRSGDPRSIFEHDKCRAMPEIPSFVLSRESTPDGGIRLTRAGEAVSAAPAAADVNKEVILRFLIDNGQQSREQIFDFGKTRGMGERTVASTLSALLESEDVDRARVGHKAMYWAAELD